MKQIGLGTLSHPHTLQVHCSVLIKKPYWVHFQIQMTVDEGPFDLLAETQEEVSQQSCKQPQDGLPEKQVKNSS